MQVTSAPQLIRVFILSSSFAEVFLYLVLPKATIFEFENFFVFKISKISISFGLDAGKPTSI